MAFGTFTSEDLITSVKTRAAVPTSQITFSDEDILRFANEELDINLVPLVLSVKEEFYVDIVQIPVATGQDRYDIPYRAIGSKVRDASLRGNATGSIMPLARIQPEDRAFFADSNTNSDKKFIYLQNDQIVFVENVNFSPDNILEVLYYLKPNDLVKSNKVGFITGIQTDLTNAYIFVTALPSNITANSRIDFIKGKPNHKILDYDILVQSVDSNLKRVTIALADLPAALEVGDDVCTAGQTRYIQLPSDLHVVLAQSVAARILEAQGDMDGLKAANVKLEDMREKALTIIDTRIESMPQKVFNPYNILRLGVINRFRRRGLW